MPLVLVQTRGTARIQNDVNFVFQILGNNECFEPYTSNIYVRRVLSGEFTVVNQHLLVDLVRLGLWTPDLKNELVAANGSVQVRFGLRCTGLVIPKLVTCLGCGQ